MILTGDSLGGLWACLTSTLQRPTTRRLNQVPDDLSRCEPEDSDEDKIEDYGTLFEAGALVVTRPQDKERKATETIREEEVVDPTIFGTIYTMMVRLRSRKVL